jgi:hypothetical protein
VVLVVLAEVEMAVELLLIHLTELTIPVEAVEEDLTRP